MIRLCVSPAGEWLRELPPFARRLIVSSKQRPLAKRLALPALSTIRQGEALRHCSRLLAQ